MTRKSDYLVLSCLQGLAIIVWLYLHREPPHWHQSVTQVTHQRKYLLQSRPYYNLAQMQRDLHDANLYISPKEFDGLSTMKFWDDGRKKERELKGRCLPLFAGHGDVTPEALRKPDYEYKPR